MAEEKTKNDRGIWLKVLITFLFALIMTSFTLAGTALSKSQSNEGDIKVLNTNDEWIMRSLDRIEGALGTKK